MAHTNLDKALNSLLTSAEVNLLLASDSGNFGIGTESPGAQFHNADGTFMQGASEWPTSAIGKSADRALFSSDSENAVLVLYNSEAAVGIDNGATIYLGARKTTSTSDMAYASIFGVKRLLFQEIDKHIWHFALVQLLQITQKECA